jgi:HEAT repeat protein
MRYRPLKVNGIVVPYNARLSELREMAFRPWPDSWVAIEALAAKRGPKSLAILIQLTRSEDSHIRRLAIEAIGRHECGVQAGDVILALLSDPVGYVARTACEAAGELRLQAAHDKVLALINSADASTQQTALGILEVLWQPADFPAVFERYERDRSEEVRKRAAWTLRARADSENWLRLFNAWSKDSRADHRTWAGELMGEFGNPGHRDLLAPLVHDGDAHVRKAAERAMRILAGEENKGPPATKVSKPATLSDLEAKMMAFLWSRIDAGTTGATEREIIDAVVPADHPKYRYRPAYKYGVQRLHLRGWLTARSQEEGNWMYSPSRSREEFERALQILKDRQPEAPRGESTAPPAAGE